MALPLSELETATRQHFMPIITNQIWNTSPILYRIFRPSREGQWGLALPAFDGRSIVEPLEYAEVTSTYGAYKTDTTWSMGTTEVMTGANFPWKMYYVGVKIHNVDVTANAGRERIFDMAAIKLQAAVKMLRKALITDFYANSDDTETTYGKMIGMRAICAADKTVGGIAQASYAWWQGYTNTAGANRDLTWAILNAAFYNTKKYGEGDRPTIIACSEGVLQNYENVLSKVVVTGTSGVGYPNLYLSGQLGTKEIDGGFESFSFKRIPMVSDPYCTANSAFLLNEKYLHWRVLKNFDTTGWEQQRSQGKDWVQNVIFGYGALTSSANRKQGYISALNEA